MTDAAAFWNGIAEKYAARPVDDPDAFEDGSLDGICAYSILHLVPDRREALARIYRLLRPGGFFVSSTVCLGGTWVPYGAIIGVMRLFGKAPRVACFPADRIEADIRDAGFVDVTRPDVGAKPIVAFIVAKKPV